MNHRPRATRVRGGASESGALQTHIRMTACTSLRLGPHSALGTLWGSDARVACVGQLQLGVECGRWFVGRSVVRLNRRRSIRLSAHAIKPLRTRHSTRFHVGAVRSELPSSTSTVRRAHHMSDEIESSTLSNTNVTNALGIPVTADKVAAHHLGRQRRPPRGQHRTSIRSRPLLQDDWREGMDFFEPFLPFLETFWIFDQPDFRGRTRFSEMDLRRLRRAQEGIRGFRDFCTR